MIREWFSPPRYEKKKWSQWSSTCLAHMRPWGNRRGCIKRHSGLPVCQCVCSVAGPQFILFLMDIWPSVCPHTGLHGGFGSTFKALWESHECISKGTGRLICRVVLFIYTPITRVQGFRLPFICTYFLKTGKMAEGVKELDARPNSLLGIHILVL